MAHTDEARMHEAISPFNLM